MITSTQTLIRKAGQAQQRCAYAQAARAALVEVRGPVACATHLRAPCRPTGTERRVLRCHQSGAESETRPVERVSASSPSTLLYKPAHGMRAARRRNVMAEAAQTRTHRPQALFQRGCIGSTDQLHGP